jgi:eukaryotic-like serine/threonine-protein kinase
MPEWTVPGYAELRALGSGGFGEVVLARHTASGTLVAIKYLRHDLLADQEFAEMFRGEAATLASLDDQNVVRLYEYVESPAGAAIVMELIDGVCLRDILARQGSTTPEAALVVLQGSLLGLAAAHQRGVVHRDYKPENVLVNGDGISKLTDFGIAARAGGHPVPAGTLMYAAPEQMAGAAASPAGDVYAATATFYECLTGRPPFSGESADLIRQHRSTPVPLDPVPALLRPLVAAGMAKNPEHRPADARTFVDQLETAASGAYGRHWRDRGRSHLGEAALLLAALWPSGGPPALQGSTVDRIRLRRHFRLRHLSPVKAIVAAGVVVTVAAAGTALATTGSYTPSSASHPTAVRSVSLQPSSPLNSAPAIVSTTSPAVSSPPSSLAPTSPTAPDSVSPATVTPVSPVTSTPPVTGTLAPPVTSTSPPPDTTSPPDSAPPPPGAPPASVCQPDGTGCTKAGTYPGPDAVINGDYSGFKVVWTSSVVQPYSSGVPLYWTAYITYTNITSGSLTLTCPGDWADAPFVAEYMSGGAGDDGMVSAESTYCSKTPGAAVTVPPGGTMVSYATFHNVPWPGSAVAIRWGDAGTSANVYPFA